MAGMSYCRHFVLGFGKCRKGIIQQQLLGKIRQGQTLKNLSDSVKVQSYLEEKEAEPVSHASRSKRLTVPSLDDLLVDHEEPDTPIRTESRKTDIKFKTKQSDETTEFFDVAKTVAKESEATDVKLDTFTEGTETEDLKLKVKSKDKREIQKKHKSLKVSSKLSTKVAEEILDSRKKENVLPSQEKEEYWKNQINLINNSNSSEKVENIMQYNLSKKMNNTDKNSIIVCALKRLERLGVSSLTAESEVKIMNHLNFKSTIGTLKHADIANMLGFFLLNSKEDSELTFTLLHEACWRLRKTSVRDTLAILSILRNRCTEKRMEAYELGKKRLVENIDNVSSPEEMLTVMYLLTGTPEVQEKVEAEASVMLPSMDPIQTYRMIYLLAVNKSKNAVLINKARKHLCSRPISLDLMKLQNLFFACGVLKIHDVTLLEEMSENALDLLRNEEVTQNFNVAVNLLISCSRLGWNYKPLTSTLMQVLQKGSKKHVHSHVPSIVTSLSQFGLKEYGDLAFSLVKDLTPLKQTNPKVWLSIVHSLTCLGKCDVAMGKDVLSPAFFQPLLDSIQDKPAYIKLEVTQQLLNIYGYLREDLHVQDTSIDQTASEWQKQLQAQVQGQKLVGLAKAVSTVLTELAPLDKYCNTNIVTRYGYTIDFEIYVDQMLKAVKIEKTEGMSRVWIKMQDYSSFVRGSSEPELTGCKAMAMRHLALEQDAALVFVPYTDWGKIDKKLDHLSYLEAKIRAAVSPELASPPEAD